MNEGDTEFPSPERLSYNPDEVDLTRQAIDWDMDPAAIDTMTPEELRQYLVIVSEQIRRNYHAVTALAKRLNRLAPSEDGLSLIEVIDRTYNPDKYPFTHETPEVGPSEPLEKDRQEPGSEQ